MTGTQTIPVPAWTELIFAVARRGHGQDPEVVLSPQVMAGAGVMEEGSLFLREGPVSAGGSGGVTPILSILHENHLSLSNTFIDIVAGRFLISLLFPVNWSYPNP